MCLFDGAKRRHLYQDKHTPEENKSKQKNTKAERWGAPAELLKNEFSAWRIEKSTDILLPFFDFML